MKKVILVCAVLALTACSSTKVSLDTPSKDAVKFTQDFGKVEVTFTDKGEWESLKSSATAAVPIDVDAGLEQGMNIALMRAKRNVVEFIQQDLKSKTTTDTITKSLAKNVAEDDVKSKQLAANQKITLEMQADAAQARAAIRSEATLGRQQLKEEIGNRIDSQDKAAALARAELDKRITLIEKGMKN
jgi:type IV secretory pathway VirB6-like protein